MQILRPARALDLVIVVAAAMALVASTGCNWVRHAPGIRGRVLDARTGLPIEGALVERMLCREAPLDLVDGHMPYALTDTLVRTRTAADGTFVLPAGEAVNLSGISWTVYAPGMMPAAACYLGEPRWSKRGGCGSHPRFSEASDPWTTFTTLSQRHVLQLEVWLHRPSTSGLTRRFFNSRTQEYDERPLSENSDPWGEYFERLTLLERFHYLPRTAFTQDALLYVERGGLITRGVRLRIGPLLGYLSIGEIRRLEFACSRERNSSCPDEFRSRILTHRLVLETSRYLAARDVGGALRLLDSEKDVTQKMRETILPAAYHKTLAKLPPSNPARLKLLDLEQARCDADAARCSSHYLTWLQREPRG